MDDLRKKVVVDECGLIASLSSSSTLLQRDAVAVPLVALAAAVLAGLQDAASHGAGDGDEQRRGLRQLGRALSDIKDLLQEIAKGKALPPNAATDAQARVYAAAKLTGITVAGAPQSSSSEAAPPASSKQRPSSVALSSPAPAELGQGSNIGVFNIRYLCF